MTFINIAGSYSAVKVIQVECLSFIDKVFQIAIKMFQSPQNNIIFMHNMQTGRCHPYNGADKKQ